MLFGSLCWGLYEVILLFGRLQLLLCIELELRSLLFVEMSLLCCVLGPVLRLLRSLVLLYVKVLKLLCSG